MSLTLYYPDGNPLAIVPPNAIKITYDRHKQSTPNCGCPECNHYRTNPEYYDNIMKEYTPQAIKAKKRMLREEMMKILHGSVENYEAKQKRKLELAQKIMEGNDQWSFMTPEKLAECTSTELLEDMYKDKRDKEQKKESVDEKEVKKDTDKSEHLKQETETKEEKKTKTEKIQKRKRTHSNDDSKGDGAESDDYDLCDLCNGDGNQPFECHECLSRDYEHEHNWLTCVGCGMMCWDSVLRDHVDCTRCGGSGLSKTKKSSKRKRRE